jgi:hypothetical protein
MHYELLQIREALQQPHAWEEYALVGSNAQQRQTDAFESFPPFRPANVIQPVWVSSRALELSQRLYSDGRNSIRKSLSSDVIARLAWPYHGTVRKDRAPRRSFRVHRITLIFLLYQKTLPALRPKLV